MRPLNTDREAALAAGDKHFEGNPCKHCKGTLRYTRNYTCVACMTAHNSARYEHKPPEPMVVAATLVEARQNKIRFYAGKPCWRHPDSPRYTVNGHCVQCKKTVDKGEPLAAPKFETYEGSPCAEGHTLRYVSTKRCVECHRAECQERRESGVEPPSYAAQKRRDERDMRRRLALIRAERTARQKACAYGVRV